MARGIAIAGAVSLGLLAGSAPALAGQQIYTYTVVHPIYGEIGTFTDTIDRSTEAVRIESRLRVAVTLLGVVAYREESDITEVLHGNRLVSLHSVTNKDGRHLEVHGEAQGDQFMVNGTLGNFAGPGSISPSDPWLLKRIGEEVVVSTSTGRIVHVQVSGGDYDAIAVNGATVKARHFVVEGDKRQEVWLDKQEVPIMFRTIENGTAIDFVLQSAGPAGNSTTVAALRRPVPAHPESSDR